ncbi:hypothetical protein B0H19DRAFT_1086291 [Mycena capillaripes]|nr:hypothetical protein B0H19DRAFT_1086291 [Mycena capillaripes]
MREQEFTTSAPTKCAAFAKFNTRSLPISLRSPRSRIYARIRHLHARHIRLRHCHHPHSLFQLFCQPMMSLPRSLSNIADARNALLKASFNAQTLNEAPFKIDAAALDAKGGGGGEGQGQGERREEDDGLEKEKEKMVEAGEKPEEEWPFQVQNITMRILHGTLVGVVGRVGAGKSSLMQGLIGEMWRIGGELSFGGGVAYCTQTACMRGFTDAFLQRENVLFGKPFESDRYWRIMEAACLLPDLQLLPDGDLTEIGGKGFNLSGGQKQRVNIAREWYYNADIGTYPELIARGGEFARLDKEFGGTAVEEPTENLVTTKSTKAAGTGRGSSFQESAAHRGPFRREMRGFSSFFLLRAICKHRSCSLCELHQSARGYITLPRVIAAVLGIQACQISNSYTLVWWQANNRTPGACPSIYYPWPQQRMCTTIQYDREPSCRESVSFNPFQPLGRIVGVFSKNTDTIDNSLSMSLRMWHNPTTDAEKATWFVVASMDDSEFVKDVGQDEIVPPSVVFDFEHPDFSPTNRVFPERTSNHTSIVSTVESSLIVPSRHFRINAEDSNGWVLQFRNSRTRSEKAGREYLSTPAQYAEKCGNGVHENLW